jgi:hypothetical protein
MSILIASILIAKSLPMPDELRWPIWVIALLALGILFPDFHT